MRAGPHAAPLLAAVIAACLVSVAIYSSFGTYWRGPLDSVLAYAAYLHRGSEGGIHDHPWYYYLELLTLFRPGRGFFWTEGLIVGLAAVGVVSSLGGLSSSVPQPAFCSFLAFYTLVLTALYAAIPYKTPWCLLGFLHGMTLLAGVGAWGLIRWLPGRPLKILMCGLLMAGAAHLGWESYRLNFRFYADQRNPYVYAHTSSDVLKLAAQMERLARVAADGHQMTIHVVTPENYWPLPWYLRRFNPDHVGYWQDAAAWSSEAPQYPPPSVIMLTPDVQPVVDANLRAGYNKQMIFGLRPGVLVSVYVRDDLWRAFLDGFS